MSALIWCPFPDEAAARQVSDKLIDEGLIACANFIPGMHSLFMWDGERGEAEECGTLFKTDAAILDQAVARIEALHPYDTPAILGCRCDAAGAATREWLGKLSPS